MLGRPRKRKSNNPLRPRAEASTERDAEDAEVDLTPKSLASGRIARGKRVQFAVRVKPETRDAIEKAASKINVTPGELIDRIAGKITKTAEQKGEQSGYNARGLGMRR